MSDGGVPSHVFEMEFDDIEDLIDQLFEESERGLPVRTMEALLDRRGAAGEALQSMLRHELQFEVADHLHDGVIYAVALLGELGDPTAAAVLADAILSTDSGTVRPPGRSGLRQLDHSSPCSAIDPGWRS